MFQIKNVEDLQKLNELVSLESQVKAVRLQDKLGKQNFPEDMKNVFEPVTKSIKDVSEEVTETMTESPNKNNQALENLNNKLEIMNDRGIIASYLLSPLSKITNPEITSQFKLVKDSISIGVNDLLIHNSIPFTLHDNLLTFRDTGKEFKLKGDLLKMVTNKNYNVDLASLADKKLMYDFAKVMNFDLKAQGRKSTRDSTLIELLKSPGLMVSASGISNTIFLSSDPDELCDRIKLLLQEKQAGNNSNIFNDEIVVIVDKLLEYKCISKKQHKQILFKYDLLQIKLNINVYILYIYKCLN